MRLRFPIPVAVLAGAVGLGAISMAGAQAPTLQPAANAVTYTRRAQRRQRGHPKCGRS